MGGGGEYPGPDVGDVRGAGLVDVTGGLGADGVLRWWSSLLLRAVGATWEVMNPKGVKVVPGRPCIVMSNHRSHYDIPLIFVSLDGSIRMLTKKELFRIPLWGRGMKAAVTAVFSTGAGGRTWPLAPARSDSSKPGFQHAASLGSLGERETRSTVEDRRHSRSGAQAVLQMIRYHGRTPGRTAASLSRDCLLYTSPSPRDRTRSRMPSSA